MSISTRDDRRRILVEVAGFIVLAFALKYLFNFVSWRFSGPASLILLLGIITLYMRGRGLRWRDIGLVSLQGLKPKLWFIPQVVLAFIAILATGAGLAAGGEALGLEFMTADPERAMERWGDIQGNLPVYLTWLTLSWVSAGFAEELFFRGYLITRLRTAFSGFRGGTALAVFLPALIFGIGHMYYQGLRGLVVTGAIGLTIGTLFVLYKRNLWPLIVAHALVDSLIFTALYMNWDI